MSISKPIVSSLARAIRSAIATKGRYYTQFDPGYVDLITSRTIPLGGGIRFKYVAKTGAYTTNNSLFWGETNAFFGRITPIDGGTFGFSGVASVTLDGNAIASGDLVPQDGAVHEIEVRTSASQQVRYISARSTLADLFDGILFDFEILDALGNPFYKFPLDTDSLTIARETLNADGSELWDNDAAAVYGEATKLSNGVHIVSTGADSGIGQTGALIIGEPTKVIFEVYDYVKGGVRVGDGASQPLTVSSNGTYSTIFTPTATYALLKRNTGDDDLKIRNISYATTTDALYIDVQSEDKIQELP